jgi:hypothetical protein
MFYFGWHGTGREQQKARPQTGTGLKVRGTTPVLDCGKFVGTCLCEHLVAEPASEIPAESTVTVTGHHPAISTWACKKLPLRLLVSLLQSDFQYGRDDLASTLPGSL